MNDIVYLDINIEVYGLGGNDLFMWCFFGVWI